MVEGSSLESAVAFVVDITAKKQYERALREGEERFRTMAESSPMMIWQGSPEQQITYVNKTLREYHQATLDALIGDGWRNYIHPDDLPRTLEVMEESHGTRGHYEVELRVQRADGMYRWFLSSGAPMLSPSGEFMGYVGTAIDIHDRKMAEEALAHYAQRLEHSNRELEQFATIASHDLQEPLRKIMLFTDHIQSMAPSLDKETQDDLKRIRSAANRMQRLINDLLDLSRITRRGKHFQKVHLGDVTEEAVTALSHTHKDINRRVTLEGAMTIEADPNQMHQMMIQLLDNALKFHKPGELSHVQVNMEPRGENQCRIRIIDDGIGIKPEHWDKIFETFVRLHGKNYPGTGIGLALVHRIVERHGGSITAHSTPEKGATFTVTLPVSQAL
jgi:PAS domain S-box-containing protein